MSLLRLNANLIDPERLMDHDALFQLLQRSFTVLQPDWRLTNVGLTYYKRHFRHARNFRFVISCRCLFADQRRPEMVCILTASSDGTKAASADNMAWLWDHGFNQGPLRVTQPLIFFPDITGLLYRAAIGQTLYEHIQRKPSAPALQQTL